MPKKNKVTNEIIGIPQKYAQNEQIEHTKNEKKLISMPKENKVTNEIIEIQKKYAKNAKIGHTK